tara:strand:- start:488 stop:802 length:315 start_codon:yes stop_codon:yes gene_type:complete
LYIVVNPKIDKMETTKTKTESRHISLRAGESVNVLKVPSASNFGRLDADLSHIKMMLEWALEDEDVKDYTRQRIEAAVRKAEELHALQLEMFELLNYSVSAKWE